MALSAEMIRGHTVHRRLDAIANTFRYGVDYMHFRFDGDGRLPALISHNRFNATALHDRDHGGDRGAGQGPDWVRGVLAGHGLDALATAEITLIAQPRVLGYLFNPVSFWLVWTGGDLRAVIAEVNNTFGDRHSYLCHHDDLRPITGSDRLAARKIFHVSPFQPREGTYTFRFLIDAERVGIWIDYTHAEGGVYATITGRRAPATTPAILGTLIRRPFGSLRVMALIHAQALKLWLKGAIYRPRPLPPQHEVSR